jgi:hypothetical protein
MVLPHLQYCPIVWGDFEGGRNLVYGETLLKLQKRFVGRERKAGIMQTPVFWIWDL